MRKCKLILGIELGGPKDNFISHGERGSSPSPDPPLHSSFILQSHIEMQTSMHSFFLFDKIKRAFRSPKNIPVLSTDKTLLYMYIYIYQILFPIQ